MRRLLIAGALALGACSPEEAKAPGPVPAPAPAAIKPAATDVPAGAYRLDKAHASLNFRVDHMGMSHWTARFTRFDATLDLDPKDPAKSSVTATIDPASLQTNYPDPKTLDFDSQIEGKEFLDAPKFPQMTYRSTQVQLTGPNTARITGDLTLHGVTKPVVLEATFNGGYAKNAVDPSGSRVGLSAHGTLNRSAFGIGFGVPAPGTTMGVGDAVEVVIEAEFTRPAGK
ncbi:MAG TPA: YceI family protein [Caulobacteraceae bacterium]|jgi:polyisoprenoid-binding protein YceI|nr:YceI family protein [Caulobacteraceae bacterium]